MTMHINNCPFCNTPPSIEMDSNTGEYKIICKQCQNNKIYIYVEDEILDHCAKKWNELNTNASLPKNTENIIQTFYGFLIFKTGEIIINDLFGHPEYLKKRFNIKTDDFDHGEFCAEHEIIRISTFEDSIAIDLPYKYTKKQTSYIFKAMSLYPYIKDLKQFSLFSYKTQTYSIYYNINELLEALDKNV